MKSNIETYFDLYGMVAPKTLSDLDNILTEALETCELVRERLVELENKLAID